MHILAQQPWDALAGIAFLALLSGLVWGLNHFEKRWKHLGTPLVMVLIGAGCLFLSRVLWTEAREAEAKLRQWTRSSAKALCVRKHVRTDRRGRRNVRYDVRVAVDSPKGQFLSNLSMDRDPGTPIAVYYNPRNRQAGVAAEQSLVAAADSANVVASTRLVVGGLGLTAAGAVVACRSPRRPATLCPPEPYAVR